MFLSHSLEMLNFKLDKTIITVFFLFVPKESLFLIIQNIFFKLKIS